MRCRGAASFQCDADPRFALVGKSTYVADRQALYLGL